ncbi:MAG: hypothetical protein JNL95_06950 [Chitinophagales bacterium]|nr:hypothetical protein [Chitinophagales bacterium]
MKENKHVKPEPKNRASQAKAIKKPETESSGKFMKVVANVGGAFVAGIFLMILFQHNEESQNGYDWLFNTMLANNLKTIEQHPDLNTQQKYEAKWGQGEITYVYKMKNETPESAVILLPPKKTFTDVGFKSAPDLPWITYFLYPRVVVYEDEKATNPNYAKANYLVSINGWGIDKVSPPIEKPEPFMILKLK